MKNRSNILWSFRVFDVYLRFGFSISGAERQTHRDNQNRRHAERMD